jgi:hypothetical protein
MLQGHRNAPAADQVGWELCDLVAVEPDAAGGCWLQAAYGLEQRAFTRAVRADEGNDFTLVDLKVNAVDSREATEVFFNAVQLKQRHGCRLGTRLVRHKDA